MCGTHRARLASLLDVVSCDDHRLVAGLRDVHQVVPDSEKIARNFLLIK